VPVRSMTICRRSNRRFEFQRRVKPKRRDNHSSILFVSAARFEKLKEQVARRVRQGQIGFRDPVR